MYWLNEIFNHLYNITWKVLLDENISISYDFKIPNIFVGSEFIDC